ncbi:MAG: TonB-dependent receptor [Bacteroidetes Order II. Incertae sedis bacterium]|jgi:outer membrane receptor for ferrienterochelin and colicins|nr:TonB-dependent receptor [Bacteroidetes Order II. bacterium]MBT4052838.1 TonB-dependent receptor [Bacteroidetes Order II. bacterium]MBT4603947.1 TonB-dependent receptor [Bacteroidetes Order II. bacterium]MBT5250792.1 TonB-dependent receptor [Bacteroidetes Order II. bacterium]MBT6200518.1 TonB-dependent receptor [Bacteroidetes Order II. bacterium]
MRTLAFIALLLLGLNPVAAQTIKGTVSDDQGSPLPGTNIVIVGTSVGTASLPDGTFEFDTTITGIVVLKVSAIGFYSTQQSVRLVEGETLLLSLILKEQVLESDEVVVTASRREQPALSVPVSVSVLSAEDLGRRNVIVLDDALRTVSGVQVLGNQINIRGSSGFAYNTGSRVLLMLDGMPLLTPESDGVPLEALPATEIERIEVLKGPGSALYGGGALGGVINVISRELPDTPVTTVSSFAGSWEPVRHEVWRSGWTHGDEYRPFWGVSMSHARRSSPRFGWWANASFRRDSGYRQLSGRDVFHAFSKLSWQPKPAYKLETLLGIMIREKNSFIFWASANDVLSPGRITLGPAPLDDSDPNGASDNFVKQLSFLPVFTHFVGTKWFYEIKGRVFGLFVQPISNISGKPKSLSEGTLGFRYGAEGLLNWIPRSSTRMVFGASRDANTTRSSFFVTTDGDELGGQPEVAVFTHLEEELSENLQVVAGLRFDHYRIDQSNAESRLSPKLSLAYTWMPGQVLRLAWGHGFRVPSFAERFTDNRDFLPIIRNLELKPERSQSIEVGIRGSTSLKSSLVQGTFSWDASAFWNTYDGFIEPRLVVSEQAFQFVNLPSARIVGTEFQLEWKNASEQTALSVGYTFLGSREDQTEEELPFRSRHQVVTSLDSHVWGPFSAGLDYRFASRPGRVETDFARFVPDAELMVDTKVLDMRTSFTRGPFVVNVIVNNALEYHFVERPALLGAPRRYTLKLTYQH